MRTVIMSIFYQIKAKKWKIVALEVHQYNIMGFFIVTIVDAFFFIKQVDCVFIGGKKH